MIPEITVRTGTPLEQRYRELLLADYTKQSLDETLSLLWTVAARSVPKGKSGWANVLEYSEHGKASGADIDQRVVKRIAEFASFVTGGPLPPMPFSFSDGRPSRGVWLAHTGWS